MYLQILLIFISFITFSYAGFFDPIRPCYYHETCECETSEPWIRNPHGESIDAKALEEKLEAKLYGQPLVIEELSNAISNHINKKNPSKALSIALHGLAGTGKSYTSKIIADFLYQKGLNSQFAHIFLGGIRNCGEYQDCLRNHQDDIHSIIISTLNDCHRALFIIDEVDDMPTEVLNSLMSFLDEQNNVFGVDPRKSIFIFLSNSGSNEIAAKTMEFYMKGISRNQIPASEMERIIRNNAYAKTVNKENSGFKKSKLLTRNLIQFHLPFLPLQREQIILCIKSYLRAKGEHNLATSYHFVEKATEQIEFSPKENPVFSIYGCRPVEKIVDRLLNFERKKKNDGTTKNEL